MTSFSSLNEIEVQVLVKINNADNHTAQATE